MMKNIDSMSFICEQVMLVFDIIISSEHDF